jgi:hypothetical protein
MNPNAHDKYLVRSAYSAQLCFSSLLAWQFVAFTHPSLLKHWPYRYTGVFLSTITALACLATLVLMIMTEKNTQSPMKDTCWMDNAKEWRYYLFLSLMTEALWLYELTINHQLLGQLNFFIVKVTPFLSIIPLFFVTGCILERVIKSAAPQNKHISANNRNTPSSDQQRCTNWTWFKLTLSSLMQTIGFFVACNNIATKTVVKVLDFSNPSMYSKATLGFHLSTAVIYSFLILAILAPILSILSHSLIKARAKKTIDSSNEKPNIELAMV